MMTTLTTIFLATATAWTWGFLRTYPIPSLRTIPVTTALPMERDLIPPPTAR